MLFFSRFFLFSPDFFVFDGFLGRVAGKGAASVVYRANVRAVDGLCVALKKTVPYGDGADEERTAREIAGRGVFREKTAVF
jgi:hypothetical protein